MCERWFGSLDAPRRDFLGIRAGIKTARKEAASAKQCIKGKYRLNVGEQAGSWRWSWLALGCCGIGCSGVSLGFPAVTCRGVVSSEGDSNPLGDCSHRLEGWLTLQGLCHSRPGSLSPLLGGRD